MYQRVQISHTDMVGSNLLGKQDYINLLGSYVKITLKKHLLCKNIHLTSQQELSPLQKYSAKQCFHFAFFKIPPRHSWNIYRTTLYLCVKAHTMLQFGVQGISTDRKGSASVTETFGTRGLLLVTASFLSCSLECCRYFSHLHSYQTDLHIPTSITTVPCVFMTLIRIS